MDWLLAKYPEKLCKVSRHKGYLCMKKCSHEQSWAWWPAGVWWESPYLPQLTPSASETGRLQANHSQEMATCRRSSSWYSQKPSRHTARKSDVPKRGWSPMCHSFWCCCSFLRNPSLMVSEILYEKGVRDLSQTITCCYVTVYAK